MKKIVVPTPQQDELFRLTVINFFNTASSHRQLLVDSYLSLTLGDIDKWIEKDGLPELTKRSRIMDFIWTHYCNCRCD